MGDLRYKLAQLAAGTVLVLAGGLIWGLDGGAAEAGAAMIGAGATMLPAALVAKPPAEQR